MAKDTDKGTRRVTIRTVAEDAGVSITAVSKVLRDAYGVSDQMRTKVMTSIEKLGYRPSYAARGMRGSTFTIGVLLVGMDNPFLGEVVEGLKSTFDVAGFRMMMSVGQAETAIERSLIDAMIDMRMDGLILIAPRLAADVLAHYAKQIPMVVIGHHEPTALAFDTVNSDDRQGAKLAVQELLRSGREDVWMLTAPFREGGYEVFHLREQGYREAMAEAGLESRARVVFSRSEDGNDSAQLEEILQDIPKPGAIFCWSDIHAVPLLNIARQSGIEVPEDLSFVGYDNGETGALPLIQLTSVDQHAGQIGQRAASTLIRRIDDKDSAEHLLIAPTLVRRGSS